MNLKIPASSTSDRVQKLMIHCGKCLSQNTFQTHNTTPEAPYTTEKA
jgi:hypothetical protein